MKRLLSLVDSRVEAAFVVLIVVALGVWAYLHFKPEPAPVGVHLEAKTAPEIRREEKIELVSEAPLKVYKSSAKKKLKLPEPIQADAKRHVVASSKIETDDHPHTVTTVLDTQTGEFTSYDRKDPLPWLAVRTTSHIGAYYGLKNGVPTLRIQGQQELLRVKAVRLEAIGTADFGDGKPDTYIGIGARVAW